MDDVGYFDEPFFQDGMVAQAINTVEANGVAYFSSAGNNGTLAYDNNAPPSFATAVIVAAEFRRALAELRYDRRHDDHDTSGHHPADGSGRIRRDRRGMGPALRDGCIRERGLQPVESTCASQAPPAMTSSPTATFRPMTCSGPSALGQDPVQIMIIDNPANATANSSQGDVEYCRGFGQRRDSRTHQGRGRG